MNKTFKITVDTQKSVQNPSFHVNTNDLRTIHLLMSVQSNGKPVNLEDAQVRIAVLKPDKKTVFQDVVVVDAASGLCEVILDSQAYVVPGEHTAELMIYFVGERVSVTGRFNYRAISGILNDKTVESQNEYQAITKLVLDAETAAQNAKQAENNAKQAETNAVNAAANALDELEERTEQFYEQKAAELRAPIDDLSAQLAQNAKQQQVTPILEPYESKMDVYRRAVIHDKDNVIYATYSRTGSVYQFEKSEDNGATWISLSTLPAAIKCGIKLTNGMILIVEETITTSINNPRVWRSTDDGVTWEEVPAGLNFPPLSSQGITETPSGAILLGEYGNVGNQVYRILRSTDNGSTWTTVLSSPGTDPQGDPGHIHSVTYDPYENAFVAFMDRPANTNYGARIYVSYDEGLTWDLLGVVDDSIKPNFVSPMYFENYIAWGYDNERNGIISRIKREDFYNGEFDKVDDVVKLNDKVFYFTFPIKEDVWVVSMATEKIGSSPATPGTYSNEILIVSDDGSVVSGGLTHFQQDSELFELAGRKIDFPSYVFNRLDHSGQSWMNLTSGRPRPFALLPYSVGRGLPTTKTSHWLVNNPTLPNMTPLQGEDPDGNRVDMIKVNNYGQTVVYNGFAPPGTEMRFSKNGDIEIYQNNKRALLVRDNMVIPHNLALEQNGIGIKAGSGNPNGAVEGHPGSIYLNWLGGIGKSVWLKQSGTGDTGWVPVGVNAGPTEARPTDAYVGMCYFDTTLNKPIWRSTTNQWIDATGELV